MELGAGFCRDLQQAFCTDVGHHAASPTRHELAAISFDQTMIRRRQSQQHLERGSPWENGYIESFNARLRDESFMSQRRIVIVIPP